VKKPPYLDMGAELSDDGVYRYWLSRRLSMGERAVAFVGLNPSTADATKDDPTIRKCAGFARRWGFDWLYMVNLHAFRSTDPKALRPLDDLTSVGPANQEWLRTMTQKSELVIAAWGQNKLGRYARQLASMVLQMPHCRALKLTQDGNPWHPLYVPYETTLISLPPLDAKETP
jgi:hypothetical protein